MPPKKAAHEQPHSIPSRERISESGIAPHPGKMRQTGESGSDSQGRQALIYFVLGNEDGGIRWPGKKDFFQDLF